MKKLNDFAFNVYSQFGEDGIVQKIFDVIGTSSKLCVEFGAWDGFHHSNTANLWAKKGWKGVLIEMDSERYKALVQNANPFDCCCIQAKVEISGVNTLENILKRESLGGPVDLLSIDVDGDDYYLLDSLRELRPRLIICEYNPTIPPEMELVAEPGNYFGCSVLSLKKLGEAKDYKLVAVTESNCFLVQEPDAARFGEFETSLSAIAERRHLTYFINGYAGDYVLSRQPTYGCAAPSAQEFSSGEVFRCTQLDVPARNYERPDREVQERASQITHLLAHLNKLQTELAQQTAEYQGIVKSISWRATAPIRNLLGRSPWLTQLTHRLIELVTISSRLHRFLKRRWPNRQNAKGRLSQVADPSLIVNSLYQAAFGHLPDPDGLADCIRQLQSGSSPELLAERLAASTEFRTRHGSSQQVDTKYLKALYRDALGREPDSDGLSHWLGEGARGATQPMVLAAFAGSAEARARILSRREDPATNVRRPACDSPAPSKKKFWSGKVFHPPSAHSPPPRQRLFGFKNKEKSLQAPFQPLADESKALLVEWERQFAPVAANYLHPLWRESRPAFRALIQSGSLGDFLKNSEVAYQFCRRGFGPPQEYEHDYLRTRPKELWSLVRSYREPPVGSPSLDCQALGLSANSLGMLYYFSRIIETIDPRLLQTIVEFGGGYGCLCRVFYELLPQKPCYVIIDLPEMLALQHFFLRAGTPGAKVIAHRSAPAHFPRAIHLLPVHFARSLPVRPDLFVSTFALSETPRWLQEEVAGHNFFDSQAIYLVGQETQAEMWKQIALESSNLRDVARNRFKNVRLEPYHFASAWEMLAWDPKP